jgi:ketosteroid isomerase-like protein
MRKKFIVLVLFFAFSEMPFAQTTQSQEREILQVIRSYDNAWNKKDAAAIERILAPEYVYFSSKGQIRSRQSLLNELLSPKYKLASAERTELKVYVTSGTAVVSSRWKGHGSYDGQQFRDDQRCSIVLARAKERWLVSSEHCTQIVAP